MTPKYITVSTLDCDFNLQVFSKILDIDKYSYFKYKGKPQKITTKAGRPFTLVENVVFGIRTSVSSPLIYRLIIPQLGQSIIFSYSKDFIDKLTKSSSKYSGDFRKLFSATPISAIQQYVAIISGVSTQTPKLTGFKLVELSKGDFILYKKVRLDYDLKGLKGYQKELLDAFNRSITFKPKPKGVQVNLWNVLESKPLSIKNENKSFGLNAKSLKLNKKTLENLNIL